MIAFKNNKGATLVELIVAILLVSIVIEAAYRLYNSNMNIFNAGTERSNIHQHVRLITDYIAKELHYATEVTIISADSVPTTIGDDYNYIFLAASGQVAHRNSSGLRIIPMSYYNMPRVSLSFRGIDTKLLRYTIIDEEYQYEVNPQIEVKNIIGVITGTEGEEAISYKIQNSQGLPTPVLLEGLSIQPGTLDQAFDAYRTSYTSTISYETVAVSVLPIASAGTIVVEGETVISGQLSSPINMDVGENRINVTISSPNMVTMTYTIIVTREGWVPPEPHSGPWVDMDGDWLLDEGVDIPLSVDEMINSPYQGIYSTPGRLIIPQGNTFNAVNTSLHFTADKGIYIASDMYALTGFSTINLESSSGDISIQPGIRIESEKSLSVRALNGNIEADGATFVNNTGLSDIVLVASGDHISMVNATVQSKKKAMIQTDANVDMTGASITSETGIILDIVGDINMENVVMSTPKEISVSVTGNILATGATISTGTGQNDISFISGGYVDVTSAVLNAYSGAITFEVGAVDEVIHVNQASFIDKNNTAVVTPSGAIIDGTPASGSITN